MDYYFKFTTLRCYCIYKYFSLRYSHNHDDKLKAEVYHELMKKCDEIIERRESENTEDDKLRLAVVSDTFCTCGNPSTEGSFSMVDDDMIYFCGDCGKQVQNGC